MSKKFLSRKFIMALATGVLIVLNDGLDMGLDTETIMYVVAIVGSWILGETSVDIARSRKEAANFDYTGIEAQRASAGTVETTGDTRYNRSAS